MRVDAAGCCRALLASALLALAGGSAVAAPGEAALARLLLLGYEQPQAVLKQLHQQPPAEAAGHTLLLVEGQVLLDAGQIDAAQGLVERLGAVPAGTAAAEALRALTAERRGLASEAEAAAGRAWKQMEPGCAGLLRGGTDALACDVLPAWLTLRLRARAQDEQGATAAAAVLVRQMQALADGLGAPVLQVLSLGQQALQHQELGEPGQARSALARALALAGEDTLLQGRLRQYEAIIANRQGDGVARRRILDEALQLARAAQAERLMASLRTHLADLHMHSGRPAEAAAQVRAALPTVQRFGDVSIERTLRHNLGVALIQMRQFDAARRELARSQALAEAQVQPVRRATELREIDEAWAAAGQPRDAIAVFHAERALTAQIHARNREAQLQQLRLKFDSEREQRNLDLLTSEKRLKDRELANSELAQQLGIAVGVLLALSLVALVAMLGRVQAARKRLEANQLLLRAQSERDPLTDLANRRHLLAVMEARAAANFDGALLMVDIDHFKHINDRRGHGAGDVVIREVARRIVGAVRHEDLVVRWGGEEFLVYAPAVHAGQLHGLAERILFGVGAEPVQIEDGELRVTVSIGFASFPLPPHHVALHWEQALNWADMALYTAKTQGRNRAVGILGVDAGEAQALAQIEADFEAAYSSGRVRLEHIDGPAFE